ncbi:DNA repair ATPase [Marinicellulosiphila megalodicopiae]|uniref:DNA repair ATPase n=1 Tax=Marinicellulosiphila megalodicopiae TaxID=2724896 RepID=UPI003BB1A36C
MVAVNSEQNTDVEKAVTEGGAYDLIKKRLQDQAAQLDSMSKSLNTLRLEEFGETSLEVIGRVRVRTENNCEARDIVQVNDTLLFGYNVFIGLKSQVTIADVFGLYQLKQTDGFEVEPVNIAGSFLDDSTFKKDFEELYSYYKSAKLLKLLNTGKHLLAFFQIGKTTSDLRVFRWLLNNESITYIDDRGERDYKQPDTHDFEWTQTTRDNHITGNHSHVSILDELYIETINGDLTIKVDNNTEDGLGIYQEDVDDKNQSLADANIQYAKLGTIIVLKVLPYRESNYRYFVFNTLNNQVNRIDAIGHACIQLPEDHGIIFPGGYYLQSGETKSFGSNADGMSFESCKKSPNGEDFLYTFYREDEGEVGLFNYNLIRKEISTPLFGHGFCLFDNGQGILFSTESSEPSRNHPMQIWQTPFSSDEYNFSQPDNDSVLGKIGNAELVRAISDMYSIVKMSRDEQVSSLIYENLIQLCESIFDTYYWIENEALPPLYKKIKEIQGTSELVLDEFEKVETIRNKANEAIVSAKTKLESLLVKIRGFNWNKPSDFVTALDQLSTFKGHLITIKELRYIDVNQINSFDKKLDTQQNDISKKAVRFLSQDNAFDQYTTRLAEFSAELKSIETVVQLQPVLDELDEMTKGLDLLTSTLSSLKVDDATVRTAILESISEVYGKLNQSKALAKQHLKTLGSAETISEFSAQFTLFSQSIANAQTLATTPQNCDEQLTRLLAQLEELETRFSEYDEFLSDILSKREQVYETFEALKQSLLDEQQRKIHNLSNAAERIVESVQRRSTKFNSQDEINTFFASDSMVSKCRSLCEQLRDLGDSVRADDIDSKLKFAKDQSVRSQRDKQDIFEDGGNIIKLGKHRFSVNTQNVDLTIIPKNDEMTLHLTGTDYFDPVTDESLIELQSFWDQSYVSETKEVYRAEYLAYTILNAAELQQNDLNLNKLFDADEATLLKIVKQFSATRYQEGYEKGIHDYDASKILFALLAIRKDCGLLRYPPKPRALAIIFWHHFAKQTESVDFLWPVRAQSAELLSKTFSSNQAYIKIREEILTNLHAYFSDYELDINDQDLQLTADYLSYELSKPDLIFSCSQNAQSLVNDLEAHLKRIKHLDVYQKTLGELSSSLDKQWALLATWLTAFIDSTEQNSLKRFIPEAIAIIICRAQLSFKADSINLQQQVSGLMGEHKLIKEQSIDLSLDEFTQRLNHHTNITAPNYQNFLQLRQNVIEHERKALRLEDFKARPLSSFVRNKLINDVYLPIIGDNLAKQMGTVGENKRTDLMGLLLLISPPGYGKTTLMEYVASRMGLIFMKINCPSLGHDVMSLDPAQAPNATARQEVEKINLGLEMGNNVMLYLDDIQHTHPEFLQKFISLCDGSRRIDGVWKGKSKTYDLRGKKFCVIMAGNPYTESGESFKIPDMLANRADIYNLGDVLSGREKQFSMSYIENCLTANSILAPLATRNLEDVYKFMRMAEGENIATTELEHGYSSAEVKEILDVLKKLYKVQEVVLKVNQQYIISAAQDDKYRIEPSFKLQGSYRNMSKMAEKISGIMNEKELNDLIRDHYVGEAQTLTTGAEENLLKLGELNNSLTDDEKIRWKQIKQDYARIQSMGGDEADSATKLANQVAKINDGLININQSMLIEKPNNLLPITQELKHLTQLLSAASMHVEVINQPVPGMDKVLNSMGDAITTSLLPVVSAMKHKLDMDHDIWERVKHLGEQISSLEKSLTSKTKADAFFLGEKKPKKPD